MFSVMCEINCNRGLWQMQPWATGMPFLKNRITNTPQARGGEPKVFSNPLQSHIWGLSLLYLDPILSLLLRWLHTICLVRLDLFRNPGSSCFLNLINLRQHVNYSTQICAFWNQMFLKTCEFGIKKKKRPWTSGHRDCS